MAGEKNEGGSALEPTSRSFVGVFGRSTPSSTADIHLGWLKKGPPSSFWLRWHPS